MEALGRFPVASAGMVEHLFTVAGKEDFHLQAAATLALAELTRLPFVTAWDKAVQRWQKESRSASPAPAGRKDQGKKGL